MKLIDTHAHLQFQAYNQDREKVIEENLAELEAIMTVGAGLESSQDAVNLVQKYNGLFASVGVHPHHVDQWSKESLGQLSNLAKQGKVVAIGEIGLDKHLYQGYPEPDIKKQTAILLPQIGLAQKYSLPILFHCRDAYEDLYDLLKSIHQPLKGLMHCFMGDKETANKFLDLGLYISFSGNITYKGNDIIREAATYVPLEKLLLETDSPYLAPIPHRGERNEPKYVTIVAETISSLKKLDVGSLGQATTENSISLLGLKR
ncbi:MAG: hypothetical protein A3F35_01625 [Candidatus Woykebacteria bacterium RIFCSPHIGHO2_12_FULL_45_10]|uniref:Hydrolase TatD n=1 Tax=Candidatus Woykebacteria bacterium RIFCSPHIGHO2_12_FULL_45_10 TaxID=1802603 RepID=A0A1G1WPH7_9BACT|nr:MAG: hypothetical protein A3F35_01625 [Candidatus Woykebacteria bacterium RIFCSPHIGHO2_12_FULL_45_10]